MLTSLLKALRFAHLHAIRTTPFPPPPFQTTTTLLSHQCTAKATTGQAVKIGRVPCASYGGTLTHTVPATVSRFSFVGGCG